MDNGLEFTDQVNRFQALDQWFAKPQGVDVAQAFSEELMHRTPMLTGNYLLQLGSCQHRFLKAAFTYSWLASPFPCRDSQVECSFLQLPFERDSIDCIVAPLTFEAFSKQKNPLSEIERVLKPMGFLVVLGMNPFSIWGGFARLGLVSCLGKTKPTLTSALTLQYILISRGFETSTNHHFYYMPPLNSKKWIRKFEFFNEMGRMLWPFPTGFYILIAQKYVPKPIIYPLRHEDLVLEAN